MELSTDEKSLFDEIDFPADVRALIKENVTANLRMLNLEVFDQDRNLTTIKQAGISFMVPSAESINLIFSLRERLAPKGYLAFIAKIHYAFENMDDDDDAINISGNKHQIGIIKCSNQYELIRMFRTDAANHNISTEDIIAKLKSWEKEASFEVLGVAYDWLELYFNKLPEDALEFARRMYEFCPDTLEQGYIGPDLEENYDWEEFEEAFDNQTIDDLANFLIENKAIILGWE
jgi:hypothetical protein